jgi:hypothetical protein
MAFSDINKNMHFKFRTVLRGVGNIYVGMNSNAIVTCWKANMNLASHRGSTCRVKPFQNKFTRRGRPQTAILAFVAQGLGFLQ